VIVVVIIIVVVVIVCGGRHIDPTTAKVIVILVDELGCGEPLLDHLIVGGGADESFFGVIRVVSQFDDFGTLPGDTDAQQVVKSHYAPHGEALEWKILNLTL
jgi:hypothetical protein